jgi:hypothetical protein
MTEAIETTPVQAFMPYRNKKRAEDLEAEIEALEKGAPQPEEPATPAVEVEASDEDLSPEEKTFKKRYGDLRRHAQKEKEALSGEIKELRERLDKMQTASPEVPRTKEQVEAWVKKYPEAAAIVKGLASQEAEQRSQEINNRLKEVEGMAAQVALEKAENEIRRRHPDFDQIRDSDDFHEWAQKQPSWAQKALYDELDVDSASRVFDLYKADKGIKRVATPEKSAALAVSTRSGTNVPQKDASAAYWSESRVSRLTDKEYGDKEAEILSAMRDGKFVYDMSQKKAR